MANSRRQRRTTSTPSRTSQRAATAGATSAPSAPSTSARSAESVDWKGEYDYVFRDLRHLTMISIAIFALLLIIGFFL